MLVFTAFAAVVTLLRRVARTSTSSLEADRHVHTRLADRALMAFLSASIGVISALLAAGGGTVLGGTLPLNELLGYLGLTVATILGLRITVAIGRDRVV